MAQLKTIYIAAVGGQGSNVLADWLFNAAHIAGYMAQAVGLPGLSQRGGATSFYIEILLSQDPQEQQGTVFGHFPVPGGVDIILAQEFLELGRALQRGLGSQRTAIVASTHRVYSLQERMPASGGPARDEDIYRLANEFSGSVISFNALELARQQGLEEVAVNAILLGALSASGLLPIGQGSFEEAIQQTGVAVEANLRAFRLGQEFVAQGQHLLSPPQAAKGGLGERVQELSARLPRRQRARFLDLCAGLSATFPPPLRELLAEAVYLLTDYQDVRYAADFLERVNGFLPVEEEGRDYQLTRLFAANLAALMAYEDIVYVARLKTRPERFQDMRRGLGIGPEQVYGVADYFSPEVDELMGLLPPFLSQPLRRMVGGSRVLRYRSATTSFPGFLLLRLLGGLKGLRRRSQRYQREQELWREYESVVREFRGRDYGLACLVARSGQMVKGYGAIRRHYLTAMHRFVAALRPLAEREAALNGRGYPLTRRVGEQARALILQDEGGVERAERLSQEVLRRLEGGAPALQELLSSPLPPA